MDYFSDRSNPFYDKTCNNEILRMQKGDMEQLVNMKDNIEYILLHVQEPILYVIRKQYRHSPTHVTPKADYYIIAGYVYQAPDLQSVINSRLQTAIHQLISAFDETNSFTRYHPTKGYSWDFGNKDSTSNSGSPEKDKKEKEGKNRQEFASSVLQQRRVDMLLANLAQKFPPPKIPTTTANAASDAADASGGDVVVKQEPQEGNKAPSNPTTSNSSNVKQERPDSLTSQSFKRSSGDHSGPASKLSRLN